jgi:hypothetical protein
MLRTRTFVAAVVAALIIATAAAPALAADTFYGIVRHVSMNNIKVYNPQSKQTLAFTILPKFDQIFSGDGKTTYQMKDIKAGRYVGVLYDQHLLGVRHANRIYLLNGANDRVGKQ